MYESYIRREAQTRTMAWRAALSSWRFVFFVAYRFETTTGQICGETAIIYHDAVLQQSFDAGESVV